MRIRSIKPEFWRSDDITGLPISTRLTFIGLWSYVDDNGVGADKLVSIVADLYADDFSRDPQETIQRVSGDLQRLASGGQVVRFRGVHNGSEKDLLYVRKWKRHQVVNHPSKGHQYPLPPADLIEPPDALQMSSGDSLETLSHEQGNRGAEEPSEEGEGEAPSPLCSKHRNWTGPIPNCPPCGSARKAFEAWEAGEFDRRRKRRAADAQAMRDCVFCDEAGWLLSEAGMPLDPARKCDVHLQEVS